MICSVFLKLKNSYNPTSLSLFLQIIIMNVGQTIKDFRKKKGIKQGEFSKMCEITQTYLSLIESNQKEPNLSLLKTISENLEVPLPILVFLSLDINDVPDRKKDLYKILEPSLKDMVTQIYTNDKEG